MAFAILVCTNNVFAQNPDAPLEVRRPNATCPAKISVNNPIDKETYWGLPLTKEYWLTARGEWFKVPFGHIKPWPSLGLSEPILNARNPKDTDTRDLLETAVSFAFWMPDLRWPERDRLSVTSFRPCENGREKPTEGQFIVHARIEWPWLENQSAEVYETPQILNQKKIRNSDYEAKNGSEEFGLFKLSHANPKVPDAYKQIDGSVPELELNCRHFETASNATCDGRFWWPEDNLGIWLQFSRNDLKDWEPIALAARSLAVKWRQRAEQDRKFGVHLNALND